MKNDNQQYESFVEFSDSYLAEQTINEKVQKHEARDSELQSVMWEARAERTDIAQKIELLLTERETLVAYREMCQQQTANKN